MSSTELFVTMERICRLPIARAAFAAARTPSGWNAAWLPTGANTIGEGCLAPNSSTEVSICSTFVNRLSRSFQSSNPVRLARSVESSSVPVAR